MISRQTLLDKLAVVAPALATNDLIPIMSHVWFSKGRVMAFNDQIAISTKIDCDLVGAVPGVLIELLKNSRAKDVELIADDSALSVKAASSKLKLGLLPAEDFVFTMPKPQDAAFIKGSKDKLLDGIECCMRSVSNDTSVPDKLGVTLLIEGSTLHLFSTTGETMSQAVIKLSEKPKFKRSVILSSSFCAQMLVMNKRVKDIQLEILDDYSLCVGSDGTLLFGRLIESPKPLDFIGVMGQHFSEADKKAAYEIPTKFELVLERACIIADSKTGTIDTTIKASAGKMFFETTSDRGELADSMLVADAQPAVSIRVQPKHLRAGYGFFDRMLVTKQCVVMTKENQTYLVSTRR